MKTALSLLLLLLTLSMYVSAQQDPAPTPRKRPGLDQFDVPGGVQLPPPPVVTELPLEPIDADACHGVLRMITYSASFERQYMASKPEGISRDEYFHPDNVLFRKVEALVSIIMLFEKGGFGEQVTGAGNLQLLAENRRTTIEIMAVLRSFDYADQFKVDERLAALAKRYNVQAQPGDMMPKRRLLGAMLSRLNERFSRLRSATGCTVSN